ncbi:MAG: hypothetical protein J5I98_34775 [Phaeodactylibacter sp.]|nr:hypothetical protein [Phaeodactylibacter sp.]
MAKGKTDITFTPRLVGEVGKISDVLADFLDEQVTKIQKEIKGLPDYAVQHLLGQFVTEEGTKKPVARAKIEGALTAGQLDKILRLLEDARILKQDEPNVFELAHDTLARRIADALDAEELEIRRAVKYVRDRHQAFEETHIYLKPREVQLVDAHAGALQERLSEAEWKYLAESREYNRKEKWKGLAWLIGTIVVLGIFLVVAVVFGISATREKERAKTARDEAVENLRTALNANAILEFEMKGDATRGFLFAKTALERADSLAPGHASPFESEQILYSMIFQDPAKNQKLFYRIIAESSDTTAKWLAFSPDGQRLVTTFRGAALLLTRKTGELSPADTIVLPQENVRWAAFSPDGENIATGSRDTVAIWNLKGQAVCRLSGRDEPVTGGQFSPNGAHLLARVRGDGDSKAALLWKNAKENAPLVHIAKGASPIRWLGFSPNSTLIMAVLEDTTVVIGDIEDDSPPLVLSGHAAPVNFAAASPSGDATITASEDHTAIVWDTTGRKKHQLAQHTGPVNWAGFSPNGKHILTASDDNTAILWNRQKMEPARKFTQHTSPVSWAAFSPGGDSILTASEDGTALLWRLDGKALAKLNGHKGAITWAGFTPDGKNILTRGEDGTVRLWFSSQPESRAVVKLEEPARFAVPGGTDNGSILTVSSGGAARLWDLSGKMLAALQANERKVNDALRSPDGRHILTLPMDSIALLWGPKGNPIPLRGHSGAINHATFSAGGDTVITASSDWTVRLWNAGTGKEIMTLNQGIGYVRAVQCSQDGKTILAVAQQVIPLENNKARLGNRKALFWKLEDNPGRPPTILGTGNASVSFAGFYPGRETMVTIADDNSIRLWDLEGDCVDTLYGHTAPVNGICFNGQGGFLSYSDDRTAIYRDNNGHIKKQLTGHEHPVIAAGFSPEGDMILTLSSEGTLKLWGENGGLRHTLKDAGSRITSAHFMQDGEGNLNILAAHDDGAVTLVPVGLKSIVEKLKVQIGSLDDAEKRKWGLLEENAPERKWYEFWK